MATNSTTTAIVVGIGALTDFIMKGEWTWRSFLISICGGVVGFFLSLLVVHYIAGGDDAPEMVRLAIMFFCGFYSQPVVRRLNKMTVKASVGGVEIDSPGDTDK